MLAIHLTLTFFSYFLFCTVNSEPCATPNSTEGECIDINDCQQLLDLQDALPLTKATAKYLHRSQCGFSGTNPKVCCPKSSAVRPFKLPQRPVTPTFENRFGEENEGSGKLGCGIQFSADRIFDGTVTDLEEFPWMALLAYKTVNGPGLACGGALINKRYVLTAAHCVTGAHIKQIGELIAVRLGEYDTKSAEDCDDFNDTEEDCAPPPVDVYIESIHPHPDYQAGTANRHHDIALIRLASAVNYTNYVQPICLPNETHASILNKPGTPLSVCGWGKTETEEGSAIKLKAKVPVVSEIACKSPYKAKGIQIATTQICAGGGRRDSCKGDSGGPLMFEELDEGRWFAMGVISFGANPCAQKGVPAVYTKTNSYLDWIKSTMKP